MWVPHILARMPVFLQFLLATNIGRHLALFDCKVGAAAPPAFPLEECLGLLSFFGRHGCKGGIPALRLVALSMPRDQPRLGTVWLLPKCPSARSLVQASFCIYPLLTSCVSLGRPGLMNSFSDVCEKLLQTRYITKSTVCAMM